MIVDQVVNNVELAIFHASMIALLRSPQPQVVMDAILRQELTNGFQSVYFPPTANTVGVYYGGDNTRKIMYLDGVVTSAQAAALVGGYAQALGLQIITNMNTWIRDNASTYFAMMTGNHLQTPEYLDFVGYSAGGAIAECLAFELRRQGNLQRKKIITFGAPRPGGPGVRDGLRSLPVARYMTPADPIPLVPPRVQDAPQLVAMLPVSVALSWSNMVHPSGGIVVWENGDTSEAIVPPESSMTTGTSLANWYFSIDNDPNNPHAISNYVANLRASQTVFAEPREKRRPVGPAEEPEVERRREVNRNRDRIANKVAVAQREQNATIVNFPTIALFKPVRFGRIWAVVLGDKIVCQGVREDSCRALCRAGNDFLRRLPKQGLVDPIALQDQIQNFLAFATAPESDWVPKLRTNLDVG